MRKQQQQNAVFKFSSTHVIRNAVLKLCWDNPLERERERERERAREGERER